MPVLSGSASGRVVRALAALELHCCLGGDPAVQGVLLPSDPSLLTTALRSLPCPILMQTWRINKQRKAQSRRHKECKASHNCTKRKTSLVPVQNTLPSSLQQAGVCEGAAELPPTEPAAKALPQFPGSSNEDLHRTSRPFPREGTMVLSVPSSPLPPSLTKLIKPW